VVLVLPTSVETQGPVSSSHLSICLPNLYYTLKAVCGLLRSSGGVQQRSQLELSLAARGVPMHGYRPAPPPPATGPAQVRHEEVAQHLAATIPGFGNPAGLKFRSAVHATTAFTLPQGGERPAASSSASYVGVGVAGPGHTPARAYVAPSGAHSAPALAAAGPVYEAPPGPSYGMPAAPVATASTVSVAPSPHTYMAAVPNASTSYSHRHGDPDRSAPVATAAEGSAVPSPMEAPQDFTCPITQEIMTDPVICADGHSYERDAITRWLASHNTSPKTNAQLEHTTLIPNHTLRGSIEQFLEEARRRGR